MKKLLLVLALLILGSFASQGAFATTYPSCSNGGSVNNGTTKDRFNVQGWCIDGYGVLQPMTGITTTTTQPNSQGGMAVPVISIAGPYTTYDSLIAQQTGSYIVDMAGLSAGASGAAYGGEYILPAAKPGLIFDFSIGAAATITIDTLVGTDIILASVDSLAGNGIKNTSKASADSVELVCATAGVWQVNSYNGTWATTGVKRVH